MVWLVIVGKWEASPGARTALCPYEQRRSGPWASHVKQTAKRELQQTVRLEIVGRQVPAQALRLCPSSQRFRTTTIPNNYYWHEADATRGVLE